MRKQEMSLWNALLILVNANTSDRGANGTDLDYRSKMP